MADHDALIRHSERRDRRLTIVSAIAIVSMLITIATLAWVAFGRPEQWNPLGAFPDQKVLNGPVIYEGDTIDVRGKRCNDADHPVTVRGSSYWQSVEPRGATLTNGGGLAVLAPGCVTTTFHNVIPPAILAATRAYGGEAKWHLFGTVTPFRPDGEQGAPRVWTTEDFTIITDPDQP